MEEHSQAATARIPDPADPRPADPSPETALGTGTALRCSTTGEVARRMVREADRLAAEGFFGRARATLQQLLLLEEDGPAYLLLARLDVALQRWDEALEAAERARRLGMDVPSELLRTAERGREAPPGPEPPSEWSEGIEAIVLWEEEREGTP